MLLFLAILLVLLSVVFGFISVSAAMMSDDPQSTVTLWPSGAGIAVAAILFAGWWFGW